MDNPYIAMNTDLYTGRLVRLASVEPEISSKRFAELMRASDYLRLLNDEPALPVSAKKMKDWLEKDAEQQSNDEFNFDIRLKEDGRLIGFVGLGGIRWAHRDAWVGIGLGDRRDWGKGYGTEAMLLVLRYGFTELNLHRVTLGVFEYNLRARRSYEKAGFRLEGTLRKSIHREGERWDINMMGVLASEWSQAWNAYQLYSYPEAV